MDVTGYAYNSGAMYLEKTNAPSPSNDRVSERESSSWYVQNGGVQDKGVYRAVTYAK
jgi:hypothetical protein